MGQSKMSKKYQILCNLREAYTYLKVEHLELPIGHFDQQCCSVRCQRHARVTAQVFWLNTYIRPNIHSDLQYCLKCPPNSIVALILACSVRQELAGHLGTHSAQCRKHITWYSKTCYTQPWLADNWQWHQQYENQTFVSWSPVLSCFTGSMSANNS